MIYQSKIAKAIQEAVQGCIDMGDTHINVEDIGLSVHADWDYDQDDVIAITIYSKHNDSKYGTGHTGHILMFEHVPSQEGSVDESKKTSGKRIRETMRKL